MWIHSIRLRDFKSYDNASFCFTMPENGKNIVLIGAENGHGKTTLLEAIYLCLYDSDAINHLKRAGLDIRETYYSKLLESALHHKAEPKYGGQYTMSLEIEMRQIYRGEECGLKIGRKWHFDHNKKLLISSNEKIFELYKDGNYQIIDDEQTGHYLNAYALPFEYAPFFFFDGEKIVQVAKQSGAGNWLNSALKGLLGVTLLERLRESLSEYRKKCISENTTQKIQDDLSKAERSLQSAEIYRNMFQEQFDEICMKLETWTEKQEQLTQQLGTGGDIRTSDDFLQQKMKLEKEIEAFNVKVKEAVKAMPLAFLPRDRLKELQELLFAEQNRLQHEAAKEQTEDKVDDFWNAFVNSEKVKEAMGAMAKTIFSEPLLKEAVKDCWEKLFYPLPPSCSNKIEHNYLSVNAHAEIQNEMKKLGKMPSDKIGNLLQAVEQREQERKQVLEELEKLKGTNKDELIEELKEAQQQITQLSDKKGNLSNSLYQQNQKYQREKANVERLQNEISNNNPQLLKSRRAGELDKVIVRLTEELMKRKVQEVGETATRINCKIAHDERIERISIDAAGRMALFGRDGNETRVDLSAGQMQILIMSLVSALAEVTQYKAPFVIDTPLARLDEGHRQGLFQHWSGLEQQVILLSQDTEITSEVCRQLEPYISKTYLVKAQSLDTAGARSSVIPDVYFD
ncbi:DNA sulfur modification protein DndD [Neisseria sp. P0009.S008]|uniref:DNA sulfur modification protein DndD n=1 Tax=unclassified Neisseria TaxID=2623750 RepID=UPI003F7EF6DE